MGKGPQGFRIDGAYINAPFFGEAEIMQAAQNFNSMRSLTTSSLPEQVGKGTEVVRDDNELWGHPLREYISLNNKCRLIEIILRPNGFEINVERFGEDFVSEEFMIRHIEFIKEDDVAFFQKGI